MVRTPYSCAAPLWLLPKCQNVIKHWFRSCQFYSRAMRVVNQLGFPCPRVFWARLHSHVTCSVLFQCPRPGVHWEWPKMFTHVRVTSLLTLPQSKSEVDKYSTGFSVNGKALKLVEWTVPNVRFCCEQTAVKALHLFFFFMTTLSFVDLQSRAPDRRENCKISSNLSAVLLLSAGERTFVHGCLEEKNQILWTVVESNRAKYKLVHFIMNTFTSLYFRACICTVYSTTFVHCSKSKKT